MLENGQRELVVQVADVDLTKRKSLTDSHKSAKSQVSFKGEEVTEYQPDEKAASDGKVFLPFVRFYLLSN